MESGKWFEFKYRDKQYKKYKIIVHEISIRPGGKDGDEILVDIVENENILSKFKIEFSRTWEKVIAKSDDFYKIVMRDNSSPLIRHMIMDFIHAKKMNDLDGKVISFDTESEYVKRVFRRNDNLLDFRREPTIIAEENRFAREIVLRELYFTQHSAGPCYKDKFEGLCHYHHPVVRNAIEVLKSKNYIDEDKNRFINLTLDGMLFVENQLLHYFNRKIFLIAACSDLIDKLINLVYKPVIENDLGYELIFQEKSEPKDSM